MSDHVCSSHDCDCNITDFVLDHGALDEYARSLGIRLPVNFHHIDIDQDTAVESRIEIKDMADRVVSGRYAGGWYKRWWRWSLRWHRIQVQKGLPAGETCRLLRHELQHAIQAEQRKTYPSRPKVISFEDYLAEPDEADARAAADREWRDLGYCLLAS